MKIYKFLLPFILYFGIVGLAQAQTPRALTDTPTITWDFTTPGEARGNVVGVGDIDGVTAGSGLTGGGTTGSVTLNVGVTTPLTVAADAVECPTCETTTGAQTKVDTHVNDTTAAHNATAIEYDPLTATDWDGDVDPGVVSDALDQVAARASVLEGAFATIPSEYCLFTVSSVAPGAGAVTSACHIWIDDSTTPKTIFYGEGVGNNFEDFAALGDAHNGQVVGATTVAASGSEDLRHLDVLGLTTAKAVYNGTATFANQPTNDGIEAVSSAAGDTTQTLTAYCTLNGGDQSLAHIITIALNGTTPVASTETNLENCWALSLSATTTGNITIREASLDATIATITAGGLSAADLDTILTRRDFLSITLNIDRDTALLDTDDRGDFWENNLGRVITIAQIKGTTDTGTSTINILRDDGSAADICTSNLVASTSGVTCTLSATEKLISAGHKLDFNMVAAATSGTPTKVTVSIKAY